MLLLCYLMLFGSIWRVLSGVRKHPFLALFRYRIESFDALWPVVVSGFRVASLGSSFFAGMALAVHESTGAADCGPLLCAEASPSRPSMRA